MAEENQETAATPLQPRAIVPFVVGLIETLHPDEEIVACEVVYVTVRHDEENAHEACKLTHRHAGGTRSGSRKLLTELREATFEAANNLAARVEAMPIPLTTTTEEGSNG